MDMAANYGKAGNNFDKELLELWTQALKDHLAQIDEKPTVKEKWEFTSPLEADLWEAWGEEAADPDGCLPIL